jgi:hypothetical protein
MVGIPVAVNVPQFENPCSIAHINEGDASHSNTFSGYSFDVPRAVRDASCLRIICSKEEFWGLCRVSEGGLKESHVEAQIIIIIIYFLRCTAGGCQKVRILFHLFAGYGIPF